MEMGRSMVRASDLGSEYARSDVDTSVTILGKLTLNNCMYIIYTPRVLRTTCNFRLQIAYKISMLLISIHNKNHLITLA